jgi:hypothetical protein
MNKTYLRQVFGHANSGYGYRYIGDIPSDVNISEFVTLRYVELSQDNSSSTIASWSDRFNCVFFYVPSETENELIASEFELIDNLIPPVVEPEVVEIVTEESDANTVSEVTPE